MTNRRVEVNGARCRGTYGADMVGGKEGRKQDEQEQKKRSRGMRTRGQQHKYML